MEHFGLPTDCDEPSISNVPLNLLATIFSHLDIYHQARAQRVCRMGSNVLSACWPLEHVEINCQLGPDHHTVFPAPDYFNVELDSEEAKLDRMLQVALSARTITLTLLNIALSHRRIMMIIVTRLNENNRKLAVLCFKDCTVKVEMALYPSLAQRHIEFSSQNKNNLQLLVHHQPCDKVLLRNYTIQEVMRFPIVFCNSLPFIEGMLRKAGSAGTISRLVVDCRDSTILACPSLLSALNAAWPSVGQDVRESVKVFHQQWVQNDENPDKWIAFRSVVNLFTYHVCANKYWEYPKNHEDVKQLRTEQLNDMTIAFLALIFKAYEINY